jgi:hypothetical protein
MQKAGPGGRIAVVLPLALAGCAAQEQLADGDQYAFRLARTPYSAARCINENAAKTHAGAKGEERIFGQSGMEVIVRGSGGTLAVAKILREGTPSAVSAGTFSSVSVLVTKLVSGDRAAYALSLVSGC